MDPLNIPYIFPLHMGFEASNITQVSLPEVGALHGQKLGF